MALGRKRIVAELLYRSGAVHLAGWFGRITGRGGPLFLMGHRVLPETAAADPADRMALLSGHAITPHDLERRLGFVTRCVMPAGDPSELRKGLPTRRRFYLTFDDGYKDNVEHARPVLDRLGLRAVIFFIGALVRRPDAAPWWDRFGADALARHADSNAAAADYGARCGERKRHFSGLDEAELRTDASTKARRRYLDENELQALPATFYAANHTHSHADFSVLDAAAIGREIEAGDAVVRGTPRYLPVLAFPFGYYGAAAIDWLKRDRRYAVAFATGNGIDGAAFEQRRINLNTRPFALFAAQCVGLMR